MENPPGRESRLPGPKRRAVSDRAGRLVVAPNWIGDAVLSLPVLRALSRAAPEERLVVLARPGPAAIYRAERTASAVTTASGLLRDSLAARQGGFSEAWLLPNSYRSALVPFLAGIPERIGYATDGRRHLLTRALAPPVLGADLDPVGLAALAARARVVVANDSGPMHLAAAVGTPVVALFGPTDPGRTGPTGVRFEILDRYVFCSPCYLKECPYGHECMREIGVEAVAAAVERVCGAPPDF